jgi:hypothetical protein
MSTYFKNDSDGESTSSISGLNKILKYFEVINDKLQFYKYERWVAVGVLLIFYIIRLLLTGGNLDLNLRIPCCDLLFRNSSIKCIYRIYLSVRRPRGR